MFFGAIVLVIAMSASFPVLATFLVAAESVYCFDLLVLFAILWARNFDGLGDTSGLIV